MISFKGRHFPKGIILMAVRWKIARTLSYRATEELMEERGANLDHSTIQKWIVYYAPYWSLNLEKGRNLLVAAGKWMRPISKYMASGFIFTVQ